jgi:hypothetical protein
MGWTLPRVSHPGLRMLSSSGLAEMEIGLDASIAFDTSTDQNSYLAWKWSLKKNTNFFPLKKFPLGEDTRFLVGNYYYYYYYY